MDQFEYLRDAYDDTTMSQAPPTATRPRALSASERTAEEAVAPRNRRTAFAAVIHGRKKHETAKRSDGASEWRAGAAAAISAEVETTRHFPSSFLRCYWLPFLILNSVVQTGPKSQQSTQVIQATKSS